MSEVFCRLWAVTVTHANGVENLLKTMRHIALTHCAAIELQGCYWSKYIADHIFSCLVAMYLVYIIKSFFLSLKDPGFQA